MKIRPVGAKAFYADRKTDTHMTKVIVAFRILRRRLNINWYVC